jgi:redox-sensitive bicupin YhaK (pirin superfamily)
MQVLDPRLTDLGGLVVRRLLPQRPRRMVGAWCFVDLFGPTTFAEGKPMDVAPHPHIGLQTVTWLLAGEAVHKDSLDSEAIARPGALNLMTSGRGIAHSEETPARHSGRLHGIQLWVALPDAHRHDLPAFDHYPERPRVDLGAGRATVILGELAGTAAEARTFSPLLAAELVVPPGASVTIPLRGDFEHALVPLDAPCQGEGATLAADHLYYFEPGRGELGLVGGLEPSRLLLLGGRPFTEPILMWWNFVARTTHEIAAAREDWQAGRRFGEVRRYEGARLDAPAMVGARPVPANPIS